MSLESAVWEQDVLRPKDFHKQGSHNNHMISGLPRIVGLSATRSMSTCKAKSIFISISIVGVYIDMIKGTKCLFL